MKYEIIEVNPNENPEIDDDAYNYFAFDQKQPPSDSEIVLLNKIINRRNRQKINQKS
jgi:hypothetical protein